MNQLANIYRPENFQDMVGQQHLIGSNGILTNMLKNNKIQSCIFYGPPGCGKTTAGKIIAKKSNLIFNNLNATIATTKNIQDIISNGIQSKNTILLYLDEIQYFNKKQQQILLPYIESGDMILIASTTENPFFCCIDSLISRCTILEFKPLTVNDIKNHIKNICKKEKYDLNEDVIDYISENSAGDMRRALNLLNLVTNMGDDLKSISKNDIISIQPSIRTSRFDSNSEIHYNLIAALQKSIRGSDPNAAVFYLARLLEGGDLLSPCRRLLVIAHEDIGLGNPDAIPFVQACIDTAKQLGLPEAAKPLTNAVIYLAISPKCDTAEKTYNAARADVQKGYGNTVPKHINKGCPKNYKYPHDYPNHWVRQQYLPDDLTNRVYYTPEHNTFEQNMALYWSKIMK